jgi:hypothetical protein
MFNFYVPAVRDMKVIEGGAAWFHKILRLREKYNLHQWLFEITRHGEAGCPKTRYSIEPYGKLDSADFCELEQMPLHDLPSLVGEGYDYDDPRIDADTAVDIAERLKALPYSEIAKFLRQFRVQRVQELRESDVEAAHLVLGGLAEYARRRAAQAQATEVDPFA